MVYGVAGTNAAARTARQGIPIAGRGKEEEKGKGLLGIFDNPVFKALDVGRRAVFTVERELVLDPIFKGQSPSLRELAGAGHDPSGGLVDYALSVPSFEKWMGRQNLATRLGVLGAGLGHDIATDPLSWWGGAGFVGKAEDVADAAKTFVRADKARRYVGKVGTAAREAEALDKLGETARAGEVASAITRRGRAGMKGLEDFSTAVTVKVPFTHTKVGIKGTERLGEWMLDRTGALQESLGGFLHGLENREAGKYAIGRLKPDLRRIAFGGETAQQTGEAFLRRFLESSVGQRIHAAQGVAFGELDQALKNNFGTATEPGAALNRAHALSLEGRHGEAAQALLESPSPRGIPAIAAFEDELRSRMTQPVTVTWTKDALPRMPVAAADTYIADARETFNRWVGQLENGTPAQRKRLGELGIATVDEAFRRAYRGLSVPISSYEAGLEYSQALKRWPEMTVQLSEDAFAKHWGDIGDATEDLGAYSTRAGFPAESGRGLNRGAQKSYVGEILRGWREERAGLGKQVAEARKSMKKTMLEVLGQQLDNEVSSVKSQADELLNVGQTWQGLVANQAAHIEKAVSEQMAAAWRLGGKEAVTDEMLRDLGDLKVGSEVSRAYRRPAAGKAGKGGFVWRGVDPAGRALPTQTFDTAAELTNHLRQEGTALPGSKVSAYDWLHNTAREQVTATTPLTEAEAALKKYQNWLTAADSAVKNNRPIPKLQLAAEGNAPHSISKTELATIIDHVGPEGAMRMLHPQDWEKATTAWVDEVARGAYRKIYGTQKGASDLKDGTALEQLQARANSLSFQRKGRTIARQAHLTDGEVRDILAEAEAETLQRRGQVSGARGWAMASEGEGPYLVTNQFSNTQPFTGQAGSLFQQSTFLDPTESDVASQAAGLLPTGTPFRQKAITAAEMPGVSQLGQNVRQELEAGGLDWSTLAMREATPGRAARLAPLGSTEESAVAPRFAWTIAELNPRWDLSTAMDELTGYLANYKNAGDALLEKGERSLKALTERVEQIRLSPEEFQALDAYGKQKAAELTRINAGVAPSKRQQADIWRQGIKELNLGGAGPQKTKNTLAGLEVAIRSATDNVRARMDAAAGWGEVARAQLQQHLDSAMEEISFHRDRIRGLLEQGVVDADTAVAAATDGAYEMGRHADKGFTRLYQLRDGSFASAPVGLPAGVGRDAGGLVPPEAILTTPGREGGVVHFVDVASKDLIHFPQTGRGRFILPPDIVQADGALHTVPVVPNPAKTVAELRAATRQSGLVSIEDIRQLNALGGFDWAEGLPGEGELYKVSDRMNYLLGHDTVDRIKEMVATRKGLNKEQAGRMVDQFMATDSRVAQMKTLDHAIAALTDDFDTSMANLDKLRSIAINGEALKAEVLELLVKSGWGKAEHTAEDLPKVLEGTARRIVRNTLNSSGRDISKEAVALGTSSIHVQGDADLAFIQLTTELEKAGLKHLGGGLFLRPDFIEKMKPVFRDDAETLTALKKVTKVWRTTALLGPRFNNTNFVGGFKNNLAMGAGVVVHREMAELQKELEPLIKTVAETGNRAPLNAWLGKDVFKLSGGREIKGETVRFLANRLIGTGLKAQMADDIDALAHGRIVGKLSAAARKTQGFFEKVAPAKRALLAGTGGGFAGVEDNLRGALFLQLVEHEGQPMEAAWNVVNTVHFDYQDMSRLDKALRDSYIPFWTYRSRNVPLQAWLITQNRELTTGLWNSAARSFETAKEHDQLGSTPWWAQQGMSFAIPGGPAVFQSYTDPFGDFAANMGILSKVPRNPSAGIGALAQNLGGPLQLGIETITNKDLLTQRAISPAGSKAEWLDYLGNAARTMAGPLYSAGFQKDTSSRYGRYTPFRIAEEIGLPIPVVPNTVRRYEG